MIQYVILLLRINLINSKEPIVVGVHFLKPSSSLLVCISLAPCVKIFVSFVVIQLCISIKISSYNALQKK